MDSYLSFQDFRYAHSKSLKPSSTEYAYHQHKKYEILYFIDGDADCVMGNMRHHLESGDVVLIPCLYGHYIDILNDSTYERIVLNFDMTDVYAPFGASVFSTPKIIKSTPLIKNVFERYMNYYSTFSGEDRNILFRNLLTELIYLLAENISTTEPMEFAGYEKTIKKSITYIENHLFEIEDIDDLCRELFISRAYLHKLFHNHLGTSPMKYIKAKRLLAARDMLRLGEKPTTVFLKVKYNDYTTFFRSYRNFFGYPPSNTTEVQ